MRARGGEAPPQKHLCPRGYFCRERGRDSILPVPFGENAMTKASSTSPAAKNRGIVWPTVRRPAWISEEEIEFLPVDARQEAVELIASTYQELVVEAQSALERAAGEEFVFLFWLGLVRSVRLRGHTLPGQPLLFGSHPETEIQHYLQLGLARQRVTNLLLRVKEWDARWQRAGTCPSVARQNAASDSTTAEPMPTPVISSSPDSPRATANSEALRDAKRGCSDSEHASHVPTAGKNGREAPDAG